jgi:hypothetical protein
MASSDIRRTAHAFGGSSAGAFAAVACAALPTRIEELALEHAVRGECLAGLRRMLEGASDPDRIARDCGGRVGVALTRCADGAPAVLSRFDDLEHLMVGLAAGAAIPPSFHPMDMLRTRGPTFPEEDGVRVRGVRVSGAANDGSGSGSEEDSYFVDGGIAAGAGPRFPGELRTIVIAPVSGGEGYGAVNRISPPDLPRGRLGAWVPDVSVGGNLRVRPTLLNLRRLQLALGAGASEAALRGQFACGVDDGRAWLSRGGSSCCSP